MSKQMTELPKIMRDLVFGTNAPPLRPWQRRYTYRRNDCEAKCPLCGKTGLEALVRKPALDKKWVSIKMFCRSCGYGSFYSVHCKLRTVTSRMVQHRFRPLIRLARLSVGSRRGPVTPWWPMKDGNGVEFGPDGNSMRVVPIVRRGRLLWRRSRRFGPNYYLGVGTCVLYPSKEEAVRVAETDFDAACTVKFERPRIVAPGNTTATPPRN